MAFIHHGLDKKSTAPRSSTGVSMPRAARVVSAENEYCKNEKKLSKTQSAAEKQDEQAVAEQDLRTGPCREDF